MVMDAWEEMLVKLGQYHQAVTLMVARGGDRTLAQQTLVEYCKITGLAEPQFSQKQS